MATVCSKMSRFIPFNLGKIKSGLAKTNKQTNKKTNDQYSKCRAWNPKSILGPHYIPALSPCPGGMGCTGKVTSPFSLSTNSESSAHPTPCSISPCPYSSAVSTWPLFGSLLSALCVICWDPLCLLPQPPFCSFSIQYLIHPHPSPASRWS